MGGRGVAVRVLSVLSQQSVVSVGLHFTGITTGCQGIHYSLLTFFIVVNS